MDNQIEIYKGSGVLAQIEVKVDQEVVLLNQKANCGTLKNVLDTTM